MELVTSRAANSSTGSAPPTGNQRHNRLEWKAVYLGSLAAEITTTKLDVNETAINPILIS